MADPLTLGLLLGGGSVLQGAGNFFAARQQAEAAREAAKNAERLGRDQRDIIAASTPQARAELDDGFTAAARQLGDVDSLLLGGQSDLKGVFAQERQVGSEALQRLQDVLLGGDFSQLELDPGFGFRQEQGNQAIERAAAAAGSFGGGGNLKDFARFNQGLASQEFGNSIQRLAGLQQIGSAANQNFASLNQQLLQSRAGVGQNLANVAQNRGSALAQLTQTSAANQANALANQTANVNAFNLQAANAKAAGIQGLGNSAQNAATMFFLANVFGGQAPPNDFADPNLLQPPPATTGRPVVDFANA